MNPDTTRSPMDQPILDAAFLRRLERLALTARKPFPGQMKGEKRSVHRGTSVEFADYREYNLGDDLRYVDWNLAGRLEKLFVKLFVEEEDLYVAVLLDASASMGFGTPSKLQFAVKVAAALGYIAMTNYDRVSLTVLSGENETTPAKSLPGLPPRRGRAAVIPFFRTLSAVTPAGRSSLAQDLRTFATHTRHRGLVILLSDFMDAGWKEGVQALSSRGYQLVLVQVLAPEEIHPDLVGDLRILDSETGEAKEMSVTPALIQRYQAVLEDFCGSIRAFALRAGADYVRASSRDDFEGAVLKHLHRTGIVV
ncbi:MAG: DUF58 domain-containing protein [Chthonomonadales bacterium]